METSKFSVKLFAEAPFDVRADELVPVFHNWIQTHALPDHMLIDVADYDHVPAGPGTVLVSLEANIHLDHTRNQPGLLYVRKRALPGDLPARIRATLRYAFHAALQLEQQPLLKGRVRFRTNEMLFIVNDRLAASNDEADFAAFAPALEKVVGPLYGCDVSLSRVESSGRLEILVNAAKSPGVSSLLPGLGEAAAIAV